MSTFDRKLLIRKFGLVSIFKGNVNLVIEIIINREWTITVTIDIGIYKDNCLYS